MPEHRLPHSPRSVLTARRLAERAAAPGVPPAVLQDFILMVSEAVSNAVRHARPMPDGRIGLRFERHDGSLRGVVTDGGKWSATDAERLAAAGPRLHHFGLSIIDALSSRWGVAVDGATHVWFEVRAARP
jgi:anti-sigma regulatory factor (Ser/Thr protein kinase)